LESLHFTISISALKSADLLALYSYHWGYLANYKPAKQPLSAIAHQSLIYTYNASEQIEGTKKG